MGESDWWPSEAPATESTRTPRQGLHETAANSRAAPRRPCQASEHGLAPSPEPVSSPLVSTNNLIWVELIPIVVSFPINLPQDQCQYLSCISPLCCCDWCFSILAHLVLPRHYQPMILKRNCPENGQIVMLLVASGHWLLATNVHRVGFSGQCYFKEHRGRSEIPVTSAHFGTKITVVSIASSSDRTNRATLGPWGHSVWDWSQLYWYVLLPIALAGTQVCKI